MEEIISINTEDNMIKHPENKGQILSIFGKENELLKKRMPEYTGDIDAPQFQNFISNLIATRKQYNGLGLAANQCGIEVRVFTIGTETFDMVCVNPEIVEVSDETERAEEGCLSFPLMYFKIVRPKRIVVKYTNNLGEEIREKLNGMTARCFQHEMDHLNGISIVDKVGKTSMMMALKKKKKIANILKKRKNRGI